MRTMFLLVASLTFAVVLAGAEDLQKRAPPTQRCKNANKRLLEFRNDLKKQNPNNGVDCELVSDAKYFVNGLRNGLCRENNGQRNVFIKRKEEVEDLVYELLENCAYH